MSVAASNDSAPTLPPNVGVQDVPTETPRICTLSYEKDGVIHLLDTSDEDSVGDDPDRGLEILTQDTDDEAPQPNDSARKRHAPKVTGTPPRKRTKKTAKKKITKAMICAAAAMNRRNNTCTKMSPLTMTKAKAKKPNDTQGTGDWVGARCATDCRTDCAAYNDTDAGAGCTAAYHAGTENEAFRTADEGATLKTKIKTEKGTQAK